MLVRDVMTIYPVHIDQNATIHRAAEIISIAEVSDLMVVDNLKNFVGVLSEGDVIRAVLPNFDEILAAGGTLNDAFQFFLRKGQELAKRRIAPLVIRDAIILKPSDDAAMAAVTMVEKQIRRLPVVEDGKLVGTVSRADICRAVVYSTA
jgi:CBS domain-containing protein